ncbi:serine/threonine-protein kinase 11-interacting protein-like isoform X2 [Asterias amurensis]|uniref:serine/threonine-protein kinase 11-interacting protein-like isoform X2 n=1 Tax=Asterias amurensis TaxID=7602 RepID=UPI003AB6B29C
MPSNDCHQLQELTVFFQKNSGKILKGRCNLALTTYTLAHLNQCFKQSEEEDPLVESQSSSDPTKDRTRPQTVKFLYSYVQRTPALKLVQPSSTLHGPVEISRFSSLTMLEIKKVPVHMLNGLGCLRNQLQVLICSRCVHSLQSLLCSCGGDMLAEAPWSALHTLNVSYNHIDALDDSLRLLPMLKMLDLSHNDLRHTRDYLECLSELAHLNLGYNRLERVPSLGLVARTNLQTLVIRNNSLDNLGGLEDYSSLLEIDLGNNCLYEGAELRTLGYLHNLREVNLLGNPLAFDPKYRSIVISKLPPEASSRKVYLDGLPLSNTENQKIPRISLSKPLVRIPSQSSIDTCNSNLFNEISSFEESMDLTDSMVVAKGKRPKGKKGSKKVRTVSIADQGTTKGKNTNAGSTKVLQDSDIEDTRREHEKKRQLYGPDWLQALQAPYQQSGTTSASDSESTVGNDFGKSRVTRRDPLVPGSSDIGSDIVLNDIDRRDIDIIGLGIDKSDTTTNGTDKKNINRTSTHIDYTTKQDAYKIDIAKVDAGKSVHSNVNVEDRVNSRLDEPMASVNEQVVEAIIEKSEWNGTIAQHEHLGVQAELILEKNDSKPSIFLERSESDIAFDSPWAETAPEEEEHELFNPLLVTVHDSVRGEDVHLFLTIKETHIEERDLNGRVVEKLEINCLKSMQQSEESVWSEEIGGHRVVPVVMLAFDYIRRDRTQRRYTLEDEESLLILTKTLQPFLEWNQQQAAALGKGLCQCLKCSLEFSRDQAKRRLPTRHRGSIRGGNISDDEDIESWMNEVPVCPSCNSDLIVELESPMPNSNHTSTVNTPVGSLNSGDMNLKPMATSSPWKLRDKEALFVSSTEKSRSGSSTEYHSANDSLSSSPAQTLVARPSVTSSSSGTSTLFNSCVKLSSPKHSQHELTSEEISRNEMSSVQSINDGRSNVSSFALPDATVKLNRGDETNPLDNMSSYEHEKLRELLQENIAPFSQKYSLVPSDILEGVISDDPSGTSTPRLEETSNASQTKDARNFVSYGDESKGNKSETLPMRTNGISGPYSEDDIVILPAEKVNNDAHDTVGYNDSNNAIQDAPSFDSTNVGRAGSTDSEIAVLRSMSIDAVSITSDCVFDSSLNAAQSNLANALSDAASRLEISSSSKASLESSCNLENSGKYSSSPGDNIYRDTLATGDLVKTKGQTSLSKESSMSVSFEASGSVAVPRKHSMIDVRDGDFSNVDHRLKLYFSMSLFGSKEELACMTKCRIFQFSKSMNFAGLVVISTHNIYMMRITKEESEKPSNWLTKRTQHSIRDLLHVHIGPGSQSFQLDFNNEGVLYTIVLRDSEMCETFVKYLVDAVKRGPMSKKCRFKDIVRDHPNTLMNMMSQIMGASMNGTSLERDTELSLYLLAYCKTINEVTKGMAIHLAPISILVTSNDLYLAEENHFWPLRQTKTKGLAKMTQFSLKEHQKITDVIEVELYEDSSTDLTIGFLKEDDVEQSHWHLQTENASSLIQLLNSIKRPWQEMFGVELKQIIHPTVSIQEDLLL